MTLDQQLHESATHKPGIDKACPVCNPLIAVIKDLERCAKQNESDCEELTDDRNSQGRRIN